MARSWDHSHPDLNEQLSLKRSKKRRKQEKSVQESVIDVPQTELPTADQPTPT